MGILIKQAAGTTDNGHVRRHPSSLLRGVMRRVMIGFMIAGGVMGVGTPISVWAAGDVNQATCPNESTSGFRSWLPDCRAFELVSPPYKDGYFPFLEAVSPDGGHALFSSLGAFAGTKGNYVVEGTLYESSRTSEGWQVKAVSPPASTFAFGQLLDASRDLSRTLWSAHTTSQSADAEDLYVREPDGSFVLVGPQLPPSQDKAPPAPYESRYGHELKYAGATPDFSHIFFEIQPEGEFSEYIGWLGDKTLGRAAKHSLYEYSGVGNPEPKLVGVRNKGRLNSDTDAEMITQCGVELGGGGPSSAYNAISSSGDTVFFTAGEGGCENESEGGAGPAVNEIYARLNEAETVDISEPSTGPAGDCSECDTSSRERAIFVGASQDGSKAFFLSGQEGLLPGAAGTNLYEYDFNGSEHNKLIRVSGEVAEPQVQGVARISEDGSHVYFVAKGALAANENTNGEAATEGDDNLYVFDSVTGATSFIAILSSGDQEDWKKFDERPVQATPDGKFLIFPSRAHLTLDDGSGAGIAQLFEYDAETGELARISIGQKGSYFCAATGKTETGYNCDGNTENVAYAPNAGSMVQQFDGKASPKVPDNGKLSADGSTVVFETSDPLTPQAVNSLSSGLCHNVYEYRWSEKEGGMTAGNVFLVSDGQDVTVSFPGGCGSEVHGLDSAGKDVFVESTDRLVSQDTDTQRDIYDAREEGGFPGGVSRPGCVADGCQGSLGVAPQLFGAVSAGQAGGGNLAPPVPQRVVKRVTRSLTRAQKLAKALAVCRKGSKKKRVVALCESRARSKFGGKPKARRSVRSVRVKAASGRGK